jgi:hypothetical protein
MRDNTGETMTHEVMQQTIMSSLTDKLSDTLDMRTRVSKAFGTWFRALLNGAPAPAPSSEPTVGPDTSPENLPPPTDAPEEPV